MTPSDAPQKRSFAERLNLLFQACAPEDPANVGKWVEYTNQQVADEINRRQGAPTITSEYIRRLRKGAGSNPTERMLSVLADFFQVPLDTFKITGQPSEIAERVLAEAQRLADQKHGQQGKESGGPEVAVLARAARYQVPSETFKSTDQPSEIAALARAARRLSPAGQDKVARYVTKLEQLEQLENEATPPERR